MFQFSWVWSRDCLVDLVICSQQGTNKEDDICVVPHYSPQVIHSKHLILTVTRIGWYCVHCSEKTETDLSSLVSSCYCSLVLLVFLCWLHLHLQMVYDHELCCPCSHVHLLWCQSQQNQSAQHHGHGYHYTPDFANGGGLYHQYSSLLLQVNK